MNYDNIKTQENTKTEPYFVKKHIQTQTSVKLTTKQADRWTAK